MSAHVAPNFKSKAGKIYQVKSVYFDTKGDNTTVAAVVLGGEIKKPLRHAEGFHPI